MGKLQKGSVVKVLAGKEKNNFLVVLEKNEKYVIISDGRHCPLKKAKKKNLKHIQVTNVVLAEDVLETDKKLRRALSVFYD